MSAADDLPDGPALKSRRVAAGYTQAAFAEQIGMLAARLSEVELRAVGPSGRRTPIERLGRVRARLLQHRRMSAADDLPDGPALKSRRVAAGYTQAAFAEQIGMLAARLSEVELRAVGPSGRRTPIERLGRVRARLLQHRRMSAADDLPDGPALKSRRVAAGYTQAAFAEQIGMLAARLSEVELRAVGPSGRRTPIERLGRVRARLLQHRRMSAADDLPDGPALKSRRVAAGYTQAAFAEQIGMLAARLSEVERGKRELVEPYRSRALAALRAPGPRQKSAPASSDGAVHPLTETRRLYGLTIAELARQHASILGGEPSRQKVWRWEKWDTQPDGESQLVLARLFDVPAVRVATHPWPAWLPGIEAADVESAWDLHGLLAALDAATSGADVDRRGFLTLSSGAIASLAGRLGTFPSLPLPSDAVDGSADDLVGTFAARLPELRRREDIRGGGAALGIIHAELSAAREVLRQPLGSSASRRLLRITAELGRLAGWAAFDAGLRTAAEKYTVAALRAAHEAQDLVTGANIAKSAALILTESGRPQDAQLIIDAAARATATAPLRVQAMITARQARVSAALGNARACDRLLGQATDLLDRALERSDHPEEVGYFNRGELAAQTAASFQLLGRHESTAQLLETAVRIQPDSRPRDRTTYELWLSESALALGDLDRACEVLNTAVPDVASGSSVRNRSRLTRLCGQLAEHSSHPAVRAVDDQVRDLIA